MIEATTILNEHHKLVYQIDDENFSNVNEIFGVDEYTPYLELDATEKYNLIQDIHTDAVDFLYPHELEMDDVKDAFEEYIKSLGNNALETDGIDGTHLYICEGSKYEIKSAVLDLLKERED